ncbi:lipoprotein [Ornithinibacillus halophilus]|uniref:Uncharacterized protein n=1 Tax=Ornithinibacillus halophilus TaxID=930117 RepID=A0A1M5FQN1_9BACI|nr:DUF6612 family protein [Ornithinibacillus halophilus]SHF93461.1 hypothetical protein SAMN05216225_100971 [Ornithinibacillus halophilus]
MKKWFVLFVSILFLTGCSDILNSLQEGEGITINIETDDNSEEETEKNQQTDSKQTEDSTSNQVQKDQSKDNESTNEEVEQGQEESENATDNEATSDMSQLNVADILLQSHEAMNNVTSLKLNGSIKSNISNFYQDTILSWNIEAEHNYHSKIVTHELINLDDGRTDPMNLELYTIPTHQWVRDINHDPDSWYENPANVDSYRQYKVLMSHKLEEFAQHASLFEISDGDTHYTISFTGSDEEFVKHIYLGFDYVIDAYIGNNFEQKTFYNGTFTMTIDKDTLYVDTYTIEHEEEISGVSEEDDYYMHETSAYQLSEYNEHDRLDIPSDVIENAK